MGILRLLINLFSQNDRLQKESLNPVDVRALIVDAALKEAKEHGDWGDYLMIPNQYKVIINRKDWDKFYGACRASIKSDLARTIEEYVGSDGSNVVLSSEVAIELMVDEEGILEPGEKARVETVYSDVQQDSFCPRHDGEDVGSGLPTVEDVVSSKEKLEQSALTRSPEESGSEHCVLVTDNASAVAMSRGLRTPVPVPGMVMVFADDLRIPVLSGKTIGVMRRPEDTPPDIVMPFSSRTDCSQIQGRLTSTGAGWKFEQLGRVRTCFHKPSAGTTSLSQRGEQTFITDGSTVYFGEAREPAFFFCVGDENVMLGE